VDTNLEEGGRVVVEGGEGGGGGGGGGRSVSLMDAVGRERKDAQW
jgi:hypothetical protein